MLALEGYKTHLAKLPLSTHTKRNYIARVHKYLKWLEGNVEAEKALVDTVERDFALRDFKRHLLQTGASANTVNSILAALDSFYRSVGLGAITTKRQELPRLAPRALTQEELRRLSKAIAHSCSLRDRAITMLMLHAGLRLSEVHNLNVGDVLLSARKRELNIRCSKGDKSRSVPINKDLGETLTEYLSTLKHALSESPLFWSRKSNRLSQPAIDRIVRSFGRTAGIDLSCHDLRHTCLTLLVRSGVDLVSVAAIAGHSRIETTRRYCLPSADDLTAAMERLNQAS